jgi:hypothetical protein
MPKQIIYCLLVFSSILSYCTPRYVSIIETFNYEKSNDQTNYGQMPFGLVIIPGKWEKGSYNKVSFQQNFWNSDSVTIAIAFNRFDKYPFNTDGKKKEFEFVKGFYEWESTYFKEQFNLDSKIFKSDSTNKFMIFKIYCTSNDKKINTYYLLGEKYGNSSNFSVNYTNKWSEEEKIAFLESLFLVK